MEHKNTLVVLAAACMTALSALHVSAQISIPTVLVGDPGNAPDPTTGSGSVSYTYLIGKYEVTNAEYAAFLNSKAASDPFELYNQGMAGPYGGITRSGIPGSYTYAVISGRANHPVNFVSFWDAFRFANWLDNGQGSGDTESGVYEMNSPSLIQRNPGWVWAVVNDQEWYKAAYYQPAAHGGDIDNYWLWPTSNNDRPGPALTNCDNVIGNTTPVGSYLPNFYGTFDMGGNLFEWTDSIHMSGFYNKRIRRGGSSDTNDEAQRANRLDAAPAFEDYWMGFRVCTSCLPPGGSVQPDSQSACIGETLTITLSSSGTSPNFQWRKNEIDIPNATSPSYTIPSVSPADAGSYDCVITNACGTATSNPATLTVRTPQILTQPSSQTVNVDQPVFFALETDPQSPCAAALQYRWQRRNPLVEDDSAPNAWLDLSDGGGLSGTHTPNLAIFRPTPGLATGYRCTISNACGCEADTNGVIHTNTVNFAAACPSDFNNDGSVDGDDVIGFFERWDAGC